MPRHLSLQTRQSIVTWHEVHNYSVTEIARLAECSKRAVWDVLALYRKHGTVSNPLARPRGRPRLLKADDLAYISNLIQHQPTLYLDEVQERVLRHRSINVSIATLSRALRRLALSHKSLTREALERNELLRATWQAAHASIPKEYQVWVDEASVDNITNQRTAGWSFLGRACVSRALFLRGQRYSILPALTVDGIIALDIIEGAVNKEKFIAFVKEQLAPILNPYPGRNSVVVLDNCAIHHDEDVRRIIVDDCGAKLVYLPPYSPDFNPIEQAFHSIKAWLRRHENEAVDADIRPWLIHQAANSITPDLALAFIEHCGYE